MFKNRALDGSLNTCGPNIKRLRKADSRKLSQNGLARELSLAGLIIDKNAIQAIESGNRFVLDIELKAIAKVFGVSMEELTKEKDE